MLIIADASVNIITHSSCLLITSHIEHVNQLLRKIIADYLSKQIIHSRTDFFTNSKADSTGYENK